MKANTFLFSLSIIILVSCNTKEDPRIDMIPSSFIAIKNDVSWISTSRWGNYIKAEKKFIIAGAASNSKYYHEEKLSFSFYLSDILKSNTITHFSAEWDNIVGGDAVSDIYRIDSVAPNVIQITSMDTIAKQISGTFTIKLIHDKNYSDKGEIIQYKDGEFDLKYVEL